MKKPYSRRDKILTDSMMKTIGYQAFVQVVCLSMILFSGPNMLGIISSVETHCLTHETTIHYSFFFNTFVLFQIFNQFNVRQLSFKNFNIFAGLRKKPLFLCFIVSSFLVQMVIMRYGGRILHVT